MTALTGLSKEALEQINVSLNVKDETQRIQDLRERSAHCVCKFCGNVLSLRKITYAAYNEAKIELYCEHCGRIEYGVEKEIYQLSEYFVDELSYDHYPNIDPSVNKKRMNVAIIGDVITWAFKNTGLLDEKGFKVPLMMESGILGEASLILDSELERQTKEE